jgi:hypothetical protein
MRLYSIEKVRFRLFAPNSGQTGEGSCLLVQELRSNPRGRFRIGASLYSTVLDRSYVSPAKSANVTQWNILYFN